MVAVRQEGQINPNTTLIDIGMGGVQGITAVYLVRGERTCLIDGGTGLEAARLVARLRELNAFPPDMILVTHAHWDHTEGIPHLRHQASKLGKSIEVLASQDTVTALGDPSYNRIFGKELVPITDATVVRQGDVIDLGGVRLKIFDTPGHCQGHISILDETNGNLFVGDAIGDKLADDIFLPPFMPTTWDARAFLKTIDTLKQLPYQTLCLTHIGCITGDEAHDILDEAVGVYHKWWTFFETHQGLTSTRQLLYAMRDELNPGIPEIRPVSFPLKLGLNLLTGIASLIGRRTKVLDRLFYGQVIKWLALCHSQSAAGESKRETR